MPSTSVGGPTRLPVLPHLGGRIRTLRTGKGMTQAELGDPYLSRAAVCSIEKGHSTPSLRSLSHLATRLDVTIEDLVIDTPESAPRA